MRNRQLGMVMGAAAVLAAAPAHAACGVDLKVQPSSWQGSGAGLIRPADYDVGGDESIVGMWSVQFLANGSQFDFGYQQWHRDHTEILNSGTRAPATENFCLGVWARSGGHYVLNHYALSYDQTSGQLNAKVNIREEVSVDPRGDTFSGTFVLTATDPVRNTVLQRVSGRVTGKRITINSGLAP